ncbi:hypothetical protein Plhal710r2_c030g0111241 [Plasmopara halstedii]
MSPVLRTRQTPSLDASKNTRGQSPPSSPARGATPDSTSEASMKRNSGSR